MTSLLCFNCNKEHDQMLVLSCNHSLCLICSYTILKRDEKTYNYKFISCDICSEQTNVEIDTLKEILYYNKLTYEDIFSYKSNHRSSPTQQYKYTSNSNINSPSIKYVPSSYTMNNLNNGSIFQSNSNIFSSLSSKIYCKKHNEEITYFCFDCFTKCICSECVVHGDHKSHNVLHIKQTFPIVLEKANEYINELSQKINEIGIVQNQLESKKKEVTNCSEAMKQEIKCAFNEIRNKLDSKEKELIIKADEMKDEYINDISTYTRLIQGKILSLNRLIDQVNSNLIGKEEVNFINFFSEAKNKIKSELVEVIPTAIKNMSCIGATRIRINTDSIKGMINCLNGLQLEITNLKGIEIDKIEKKVYLKKRYDGLYYNTDASIDKGVRNRLRNNDFTKFGYGCGSENER